MFNYQNKLKKLDAYRVVMLLYAQEEPFPREIEMLLDGEFYRKVRSGDKDARTALEGQLYFNLMKMDKECVASQASQSKE